MPDIFIRLKRFILRLFSRTTQQSLKTKVVEEVKTENLKQGCIYIERRVDKDRWVHFVCPDGCGAPISLNLMSSHLPYWTLTYNSDNTITLSPSVWKDNGCRSHFFIRNSEVEWAG